MKNSIKGEMAITERLQPVSSLLKQRTTLAASKLVLASAIATLLLVAGCTAPAIQPEAASTSHSTTQRVAVRSTDKNRRKFQRSVYASTGVGASRLNPDNSQIPTWNVSDKVNAGGQIAIGADLNRHFSLELHSADLGSAGVEKFGGSLRGRINYHMHGGSVLWYAGKNRHNLKRRGFSGYGRAGVAMMDNSPVGDAPYSQANQTQLLVGGGLEFATKMGMGLRAEVISFDSDAQYAQLGFIYRMGKAAQRTAPVVVVEATPEPAPIPTIAAARVAPLDSDNDGTPDAQDRCKSTGPQVLVDDSGCAIFDGVLEGVNFFSASERLTPKARDILDGVAKTLKQYPQAKISVMAHTDDRGSDFFNQNLATRRAKMVVLYLSIKGIDRKMLVPTAFGESKPISSNETVQGRAANRRVELQAIK